MRLGVATRCCGSNCFWIFGHPEVYIVFLPSFALIAMIVPTMARTKMPGYG